MKRKDDSLGYTLLDYARYSSDWGRIGGSFYRQKSWDSHGHSILGTSLTRVGWMLRRYMNMALTYGVVTMVFGVSYREFTKSGYFNGKGDLFVMHTRCFF